MPNAQRSRALALVLVWSSVMAALLVAVTGPAAAASDPTVPGVAASSTSSTIVSMNDESVLSSDDPPLNVLGKIAPALHGSAQDPQKGLVDIVVHAIDLPQVSRVLEAAGARLSVEIDGELRSMPFVSRPWGAVGVPTSLRVQVPESSLVEVAASPHVLFVDTVNVHATTFFTDEVVEEERTMFNSIMAEAKAAVTSKDPVEQPTGTAPSASPTSWAVAREHKAWDAWQLGYQGQGVNVAVVDTGEDFGHPSMQGQWAVAPPGNPWAGWPIMFHPASMEGLMGNGWWTAGSDLDRLPLPFWLSVNDGDVWYSNTDYKVNDSNLDGYLPYSRATPDPQTGNQQWTPQANPQQYGNWGPTWNQGINRNYYVGCAGLPGPCIASASGIYRLGVNRDDSLTGLWGQKVGMLLVDSTIPEVYDTVYVDLNFDFNFTNDKPVTQADPIATADIYDEIAGGPGQDGVADISGGLLYFIGSSQQITGEVVISNALGTEMGANLANGWVAVDIDGRFSFVPATQLWLVDPLGFPNYFPSRTEDIYEEFSAGTPIDESGTTLDFGTGSFGPVNVISFQSLPGIDVILRGPGPDYGVDFLYDAEECDATFTTCTTLVEGTDYSWSDQDGGSIRVERDIPDTYVWFFIYQLDTYTLETVSGALTFARAIPAGWDLVADYQTGLPIPYSQEYGPSHGYDTFIPANGDMVAFHGEFDNGQSHGSFVSSTVAATPFGNLISTNFEVFGTAPKAKIIGIAACCNSPGPVNLFGSIEDQRTFAALGYDGLAGTGDEAVILTNSFGDPGSLETGLSWEDRWLLDFWTRYPELTTLVAMGNNGPGYATSAPGGSSPGVIGVAAGNSMDYRIMGFGDTGTGAGEVPVCPGPPPIDPATCVGVGSTFGPGPYGDPAYFSSRGPTLLGSAKPDIMSVGQFGWEAAPLNVYCFGDPTFCDGNAAFDLFSGTSMATPVTAGVTALVVQAYRSAHGGANPTNDLVKELLKSGADDIHRDVLTQGAGWTNALRSVEMAEESNGVSSNVDSWLPGDYGGIRRLGFVNLLASGTGDSTTITLENHNPGSAETVQIQDAVYARAARYTYSFPITSAAGHVNILRPTTAACGGAGVYASNGCTLLQAMPFDTYWNNSDFVKVTFTYDVASYASAVIWRLDTFIWYDANANNLYGGAAERNRITVALYGAGAHSVWDSIHDPDVRAIDGWVLNPRPQLAPTGTGVPATLIVEFYEKADWAWVSTSVASLNIPATATRSFQVTANTPLGTPAGMYEGAVYVTDFSGDITTIPIVINVPVSTFPVTIGGNVPTTSLYDNNGMIGASRSTSPWRQTGDSRYVYADVNVAVPPAGSGIGRNVIYQAFLTSTISDPEMFVYDLRPDTTWTDDAVFGPGTFGLLRATGELVGATTTSSMNKELMFHTPPLSGFIAFQVKAWGSIGETDPMQANIGIMEVTPTAITLVGAQLRASTPVSVWANIPLVNGIGAAVTQGFVFNGVGINIAANPDYYPGGSFDGWVCSQVAPNSIVVPPRGPVISRSLFASITSPGGTDDHDLQVYLDENNNGACDLGVDTLLCQSAGATATEACTATTTDGTKNILIQVGIFGPGSDTFSYTWVDTIQIIGVSAFYLNGPSTTVAPYTTIAASIGWDFPQGTPEGPQSGITFVSPGFAQFALVQQVAITVILDYTAPTINVALDLSPIPNSVIPDAAAGIVANIADSRQVDRFSPQLWVDGVDVTGNIRVLAPYIAGSGYTLVTVAWEHVDAPWDDGRHSALLTVRDIAGNLKTQIWSWVVDTTGPAISVTNPPMDALTTASSWPFEAETEPGATVTVTVNGVPATIVVSPEGRISGTLSLAQGTNMIVVTAEDSLLNVGTATRTVTRDSIAPGIVAFASVSSPTNEMSTTVTGMVDEDVTSVWVDGVAAGVAVDGSFMATVPLVEGSNTIQVVTWDAAGNQGVLDLPAIVRDTIAPTINAGLLVGGIAAPTVITDRSVSQITVAGSAPDADVFYVLINGEPVGGGGAFSRVFDLVVGDNVFVVHAVDDAGNVGTFTVSVSYAPQVIQERTNYNAIIASGLAVVLLIVGFVVGFLLSGRGGGGGGGAPSEAPEAPKGERRAEEELPTEGAPSPEEEEL